MVSRQAATGFSGSGTLKAGAIREATQFCLRDGKLLKIVRTQEAQPPYILANFPKAEVQFRCLKEGHEDLTIPNLKQQANSVVEIRENINVQVDSAANADMYAELIKLDDLLKKGIITKEEFEEQKTKVLSD